MKNHIKMITTCALMMALVIVSTMIRVPGTRIHLGNTMCLFSGFLFMPMEAGVVSGLGSFIYDLLFYPGSTGLSYSFTFLNKFFMGFFTSLVFRAFEKKENFALILGGVAGEVAYIILYMTKTYIEQHLILNVEINPTIAIMIEKLGTSIINAVFAIVFSFILYKALNKKIKEIIE